MPPVPQKRDTTRRVNVGHIIAATRRRPPDTIVAALRSHLDLPTAAIVAATGLPYQWVETIARRDDTDMRAVWREACRLADGDTSAVAFGTEHRYPEPGDGWQQRAACVGHDPNLWFCETDDCDEAVMARRICLSCDVIGECAANALREPYGVWGGLSERSRRDVRRYLRLGVVPNTVAGVGLLATEMASAALRRRGRPAVQDTPVTVSVRSPRPASTRLPQVAIPGFAS